MFFHRCINFVDVGSAQFIKAGFISLEFGRNLCELFFLMIVCIGTYIYKFCDMEGQGLDLCVFDAQFFDAVFMVR